MNRAERRAAKFKRPHHDRNKQVEPSAALAPVAWSSDYTEEEASRLGAEARLAWHKLTHGNGTEKAFDVLAQHINTAAVLAHGIDASLHAIVDRAQHGLAVMQARYRRLGTFGADAQTLADVPQALDVYDTILRNTTPRMTVNAYQAGMRNVRRGHVRRAS